MAATANLLPHQRHSLPDYVFAEPKLAELVLPAQIPWRHTQPSERYQPEFADPSLFEPRANGNASSVQRAGDPQNLYDATYGAIVRLRKQLARTERTLPFRILNNEAIRVGT